MDKLQKVTLANLADVYFQQFHVMDNARKKMYEATRDARIFINEQFGIHQGMIVDVTKPMINSLSDFTVNGEPVLKAFVMEIEFDGDGISVTLLNSKGFYFDIPIQLLIEEQS